MHLFVLALAPSLLWLWWFWKQEVDDREEARPLARAFLFGALSVIPAAIIELFQLVGNSSSSWSYCFFVIGPTEELCKAVAMRSAVWTDKSFDQPADGIVYAAAAALGFAFAENLGYFHGAGGGLILTRTLLSVPGHVLFAVPWGAAMGRRKLVQGTPRSEVWKGLLYGSLIHSLFDGLLFHAEQNPVLFLGCFGLLVRFQWKLFRRSMNEAIAQGSPHPVPPPAVAAPGAVAATLETAVESVVFVESDPIPAVPIAPTPPIPAPVVITGLQWRYVWLSTGYGIVLMLVVVGGALCLKSGQELNDKEALLLGECMMVSLLLAGLISAYKSPGRTVRESALGLGMLGVFGALISPGSLAAVIPLMILGAFGGWLGEALSGSSS